MIFCCVIYMERNSLLYRLNNYRESWTHISFRHDASEPGSGLQTSTYTQANVYINVLCTHCMMDWFFFYGTFVESCYIM